MESPLFAYPNSSFQALLPGFEPKNVFRRLGNNHKISCALSSDPKNPDLRRGSTRNIAQINLGVDLHGRLRAYLETLVHLPVSPRHWHWDLTRHRFRSGFRDFGTVGFHDRWR